VFHSKKIDLPPRQRNVIEKRMHLIGRSPHDFLRFLPSQLLHGGVVVLLRLRQEHFEHAALVLLLERVEVVDDDTDEQVQGEERPAHDEDHEIEVVVLAVIRLMQV
jgi:hypothetical protein